MRSALQGLVVADLSETIAGQYCARLLGDFGADVTLLEPPEGSATRRMAPFRTRDGLSLVFRHLNTGKRSRRLPADPDARRAMLQDWYRRADVVVLPAEGCEDEVERCNPQAVALRLSPFGSDGPLRDWKGPEIVLQALSGMMHNNGAFGREPLYGCGNRASFAAGLAGAAGVLAALLAREATGLGQGVRVDEAETAAAMCFPYVLQYNYNGTVKSRLDPNIPAGQVLCRDGWVCIWIYNHRWAAVCRALGLGALETDPRFSEPLERRRHWAELFALIQDTVADREAEAVVAALQREEVIAAKAYRPSELAQSGHLAARGYWERTENGIALGAPFRLSRTPRCPVASEPAPGAHDADALPASRFATAQEAASGLAASRPLAGLRVLEIATAWAGPMAGRVLGFLGAESIHIESPNRVNSWRLNKEVPNPVNFPGGEPGERPFDRAFLFNSQNVDKLSCILNLKDEGGRATLRRLVEKADVLICNFRPGTLDRLGLGYEALREIKPDIIVAELPAYGLEGPMSRYAALGPTMEMAAGMSGMIGYRDGQPETTGPSYLDPIGGFNAAVAILVALNHRARTGEGQHVEVPQVEAAMQVVGPQILAAIENGTDPVPDGNRVPTAGPHEAYPTAGEDQWVVMAARDDREWQALARVVGGPALAADPRFATLADRLERSDEIDAILRRWTRTRDKHAIADALQAAGVPAAPVQTPRDLSESAYLAHRGFFTRLEHPDAGAHAHPGLPIRLSRTPGAHRRAAPAFGAHNRHVLEAILQLSGAEVEALRRSPAMADAPLPGA
ncbi:CoA transferase [Aureimonas sp. AU4]|uniref:CaiB/BaiF CoA-transferase family protein n=1 Tax=Aureimonas sp. AU4 TaxID=1638163 RepID=UPI00178CDF8C|nr:CoA transferase [Aureimonas sp. AU4]